MKCPPLRFFGIVTICLHLCSFAVADTVAITAEVNDDIKALSFPVFYSENNTAYINLEQCFQQLDGIIIAMTDQIETTLDGYTATLIANHPEVALQDKSFSLSHPCLLLNNAVSIAVQDLEMFFQQGYGMSVKAEYESSREEHDYLDLEGDETLLLETVDDISLPEDPAISEEEAQDSEEANERERGEEEVPEQVEESKAFEFTHLKDRSGAIVLDPAHGGNQGGISLQDSILEKELLLQLALHIQAVLEENTQIKVILTRSEDIAMSLSKRKSTAEKTDASLFISLESGFSYSPHKSGMTLWSDLAPPGSADKSATENDQSRETQRNAQADRAWQYARNIQQSLSLESRFGQIVLRQAPLILQREINQPVLLIETGYLSNPATIQMMENENEVERLAFSLAWAIAESLQ